MNAGMVFHGKFSILCGVEFVFGASVIGGNTMNPLIVTAMFPVAFVGLIAVAALNGM